MELSVDAQNWLEANASAVEIAQKNLTKKGDFIIPLEKPWPEWEAARVEADNAWYAWQRSLAMPNVKVSDLPHARRLEQRIRRKESRLARRIQTEGKSRGEVPVTHNVQIEKP